MFNFDWIRGGSLQQAWLTPLTPSLWVEGYAQEVRKMRWIKKIQEQQGRGGSDDSARAEEQDIMRYFAADAAQRAANDNGDVNDDGAEADQIMQAVTLLASLASQEANDNDDADDDEE